jgi:hypothetical protein
MEPRLARRQAIESRRRLQEIVSPPRALLRPAPQSARFFPLVVVAAVLPGLYALNWWDLNPPGPWWGLRGLAVLDGRFLDQVPLSGLGPESEALVYRAVAMQPPLYAWLEAAGLLLSPHRDPLATVLPSYVAGALIIMLTYLHGRLWRGPGLGLTAAILTALNRDLLIQMQQAAPATLGIATLLASLFCYGQHLRTWEDRRRIWALLGGAALGLSLLSVGLLALLAVPIVLLHQAYLGADPAAAPRRPARWWRPWLHNPSLLGGVVAVAVALAIATPWHLMMLKGHGLPFVAALSSPPGPAETLGAGLVPTLLALAPAILPLALLAAVRLVRQALAAESEDSTTVGGTFWVIWLAVAAVAPALWPSGPLPALTLLMLVPLNLLAAEAMTDLASRRIPARTLIWLAPATACSIAWWVSSDLRGALVHLIQGERIGSATVLGLHLGIDLVVILVLFTRRLDRWARRRDVRRRFILAGFLIAVIAVTAGSGLREVRFRHRETAELLDLRDVILRRQQAQPFGLVAVVGPDPTFRPGGTIAPGGRLRFILRSTLPDLRQIDLSRADDLLKLPHDGQRLVILIGTDQRLTYSAQSRLGLEVIHPGRSGVLDAFASSHIPERRLRR